MNTIFLIGLILCCLTYLLSSALIFSSKAQGHIRSSFVFTFLAMVMWSGCYAIIYNLSNGSIYAISPILESTLAFVWLALLLAINLSNIKTIRAFIFSKYSLTLIFGFLIINLLLSTNLLMPDEQFKLTIVISLLSSILQLILLEQIYRHSGEQNWGFKPLVLGLAAVNIFNLVMMSTALLLNQIDSNYLAARPFIFTLVLPLILLTMKRVESWNLRIFISREVVLHSSLISFSGVYLLLMSAVGYYIQQTGQVWTGVVQIVFVAGALLALAYIFISDSVRKYFKTFIQKHFYANQFDYREQWLQLTQILDNPKPNSDFYQVSLEGVLTSLQYQYGLYGKFSNNTFEVMASNRLELNDEAILELVALAEQVKENRWLLDVSDFDNKEYLQFFEGYNVSNLVDQQIEIVLPVFIEDKLSGLFLLSSLGEEKIPLNWEVRDYLNAVSSQLASFIRFNEAQKRLEENAKFDAFNRMSAFVVHDLKNVIAQIGMIVSNGEKYKHIPEFIDDTFETLGHTKERMDRMLKQLKEKQQQRSVLSQIDLTVALQKLCQEFARSFPQPEYIGVGETIEYQTDSERFHSVIGHLIDNAQHATEDHGFVRINLKQEKELIKITISDSGIGMEEEFINNQLFKPFETTKGNAGMGVGVYEAKSFAEEFGGTLTVQSILGQGTTFVMTLPNGI